MIQSARTDARRAAREGGSFYVYYTTADHQAVKQFARTKEENDNFADALPLMGVDPKNVSRWVRWNGAWNCYQDGDKKT